MKHVIAVVVLLAAACAPEIPTMAETSGGEAGSVGVASEALLSTNQCGQTQAQFETLARDQLGIYHGGGWSWTGALSGGWTGNNTVGSHFSCSLSGTDSVSGVRRNCTLTSWNGNVFVYTYKCTTGGGLGSPVPPSEICTQATSSSQATVYSKNPC